MITPSYALTATERVLPRMALDFTTAALDPRVTFTRTTSALNPATFINNSGVITAATNNEPRFDFDPITLVCKGLLIEESRTNSLLNSDTLSTQTVTVTAAARTLSFYGTGQIVLSGTASATITGTGAYPTRTTYTFTPTAGSLTLTVTGTVQYAQLEAGAFATSYIPTTIAALTRNADVARMTGTNFSSWFNATEGAFQIQTAFIGTAASRSVFYADDNTTNNYIGINTTGSALGRGSIVTSGAPQAAVSSGTSISAGNTAKVTLSYKLNNVYVASNGATANQDITVTLPTINQLQFATFTGGAVSSQWLAKLNYYPQWFTAAETQASSK